MQKQAGQAPVECVKCGERFDEGDVRELRYFPSTQVCYACYKRGQQAGYQVWCFGKASVLGPSGKVLEFGFDPEARACRSECPDRRICSMFLSGVFKEGGMRKREKSNLVCPFRQTKSQIARVWMMCATRGMMIPEVVSLVKREGGDAHRVLRVLRSGELLGVRWRVDEENGFLKLTYVSGGRKRASN